MKKLLMVAAIVAFGFTSVNAQDEGGQTDQGSWLVQANTGFGEAAGGSTGIYFRSVDGTTSYSIGFDAGYFVMDNLAVLAGLGYADSGIDGTDGAFGWKVGGKYYINGKIPVGLDINGASTDGFSPMFLGVQAGYAWFLGDMVSIEPGIRYGYGMNEEAGDGDFNPLSINIGFALHF